MSDNPMEHWQMLDQVPKQKVHFVQQHDVAVQALNVVAVVVIVVVAAELPLIIACFAIPIQFEFS